MKDNVVKEEKLYTYDAAIAIYERKNHNAWVHRQKKLQAIRKAQQERRRYFLNQKLTGLMLSLLSLVLLVLTREALTIIGIVTGMALMITKKMVIYNDYARTHSGGMN